MISKARVLLISGAVIFSAVTSFTIADVGRNQRQYIPTIADKVAANLDRVKQQRSKEYVGCQVTHDLQHKADSLLAIIQQLRH